MGKERLVIPKERMLGLLTAAFSRRFGPVEVIDFGYKELSPPNNRKSIVYKVDPMEFKSSGVSKVPQIPPCAGFKIYKEGYVDEHETEKRMLSLGDQLVISIGGRNIEVYPEFYSKKVPECDESRVIIREYMTNPSLLELILDKDKKGESVEWRDVNGTLRSLALLHVYTPWITDTIETFSQVDASYVSENFSTHFGRLYYVSTGKELSEKEENEIRRAFSNLSARYLFKDDLIKVISGDLSACPHHATNDRLLDAGGTAIGYLMDDLALYSYPIFSKVKKDGKNMSLEQRGNETLKEYLEHFSCFADVLKFPNDLEKKFSFDFLLTSWLVASLRGTIRGASSLLAFNYPHIRENLSRILRIPILRAKDCPSWVPRIGEPAGVTQNMIENEAEERFKTLDEIVSILGNEAGIAEVIKKIPRPFRINNSVPRKKIQHFIYGNNKVRRVGGAAP